tara:strand:- start:341 stop:520 length:180 start_codon:yes stop_codon:yes gene_type:complete
MIILTTLEERFDINKEFIEVTKSEYNMFKDYLRSYKEDKLVEFANNIMYNGKILKVANE